MHRRALISPGQNRRRLVSQKLHVEFRTGRAAAPLIRAAVSPGLPDKRQRHARPAQGLDQRELVLARLDPSDAQRARARCGVARCGAKDLCIRRIGHDHGRTRDPKRLLNLHLLRPAVRQDDAHALEHAAQRRAIAAPHARSVRPAPQSRGAQPPALRRAKPLIPLAAQSPRQPALKPLAPRQVEFAHRPPDRAQHGGRARGSDAAAMRQVFPRAIEVEEVDDVAIAHVGVRRVG